MQVVLTGCYCSTYATSGCLTVGKIKGHAHRQEIEKLVRLLDDDRSWVREEAALALGEVQVSRRTGRPGGTEVQEGQMSGRPGGQERTAVRRLEEMVVAPLEKLYVRSAAATALGQIADPPSFAVLSGVAASAGIAPDLKLSVIKALCSFDEQKAIQAIAPLTQDEDILVAAAAQKQVKTQCR